MTPEEAVAIVREQTIPALRGSGGSGHVEALEQLLHEREQLLADVRRLAQMGAALGEDVCAVLDRAAQAQARLREVVEGLQAAMYCMNNHSNGPACDCDQSNKAYEILKRAAAQPKEEPRA